MTLSFVENLNKGTYFSRIRQKSTDGSIGDASLRDVTPVGTR